MESRDLRDFRHEMKEVREGKERCKAYMQLTIELTIEVAMVK